jgi:small GTP-binding protein
MAQTANRYIAMQSLKGQLIAAYEYLTDRKDVENAGKVKQLAGKLANEEFTIAFCGHFSAGKSTIINRLVGEDLLPSSPIPTSANLVKVKAGTEYAKVFFKNGKPRVYLAPYDYNLVKQYCKDGDQIREIEISHADSKLPSHTVIMDTPGIDSADDAHRIATESAIHLADLIFYVMDYNHVQAELNFMFTKELSEAGKAVYLVVNQVDKHSSRELSFSEFKTSVAEAFASWGVNPAAIFYTSLKRDDHTHNQFSQLQDFLAQRLQEKDGLLLQSVACSLQKIMKDHLDSKKKKLEQEMEPFQVVLNELSFKERDELADHCSKLTEEKDALREVVVYAESEFDAGMNKILANAYLMPFQTREIAKAYLESCQSDFKVGLLFTKQKTLAERQKRLELFYQDILEKTKSQVEWHLRNFLVQFLMEKRVENKELLTKSQNFSVDFSSEVAASAVKSGARLSGDSVINYTEDVANEIKRLAKNGLAAFKSEMLTALREKNKDMQARIAEKLGGLERYGVALEQVKQYEAVVFREQQKIETLLAGTEAVKEDSFHLFEQEEEEFEVVYGNAEEVRQSREEISHPRHKPAVEEMTLPAIAPDRLQHTAGKLQAAARLVQGLPGFAKLALELQEKAERLEHKGFSVALFGAFSAGKSSFANALIGESVLPVSPNPMTAAINKIKPVSASYPHGTVLVKLKAEQAMLEDVNQALMRFDFQVESLVEARAVVEKIKKNVKRSGADEKTGYTFLQAFVRGYADFAGRLGSMLTTTITQFGDYVAQEEKSCFVEWIDLYYDCPLTRKGITLVDTPGADSINVRHTGVAFEFIKNSDAILFVTYYNHAFSKADREFLIQLGRVKEAFQLDKMFFVINAIDLADNMDEKEAVRDYVQDQLIKYGVREPHLYSLSSLQALKEKQAKVPIPDSGMADFEVNFYRFITHDLANMVVAAGENEMKRVCRLVEKLMESTQEDDAVKRQKRANLKAEKAAIREILRQQTAQSLKQRLEQEIEELIYYIKQRVFLRFNDFFREAFHPAVLRDDGRDLKKVLKNALNELREQIGFDFAQEMRATTVRLDRFAEKIAAEYQSALGEKLQELNQDLSFSCYECNSKGQLDFAAAFNDMEYGQFAKAMTYFKSPKAFFEKQENKVMSEELYRIFNTAADEYLQTEQNRIRKIYEKDMERTLAELVLHMTEQVDDFYFSLLSALEGGVTAKELTDIRQNLAEVIKR